MFSHLSVSHSVHRGRGLYGGGMHGRGACVAGKHAWWGACMAGGIHGRGACMAGGCVVEGLHCRGACISGEMTIAADGTHPTGMHSCY